MMTNFTDFLRKQEEVYVRFRDTTSFREQGTQPPAYLGEERSYGSYAVVLRHPREIVEGVTDLSLGLAGLLPIIRYDDKNTHTTLLTTDLVPDLQPDRVLLENLARRVHDVKDRLVRPTINYSEMLYNRDSVIAAGFPDAHFVDAVTAVTEQCKSLPDFPLAVKSAWGSHITIARFLEKHSPSDLAAFFKEMEHAHVLGTSLPEAIDVGYFSVDKTGFFLETYERFPLA